MYLNRITLIGFTGQDPKTSVTQSGTEVTRFSLATTKRYQQDSEWKEKTQWHDCVVIWNRTVFQARFSFEASFRRFCSLMADAPKMPCVQQAGMEVKL